VGNQTISGPTQTAIEGASNEWAPRPFVARSTRFAIHVFPYVVGFTFAVLAGRFYPPEYLDVNRIVWFVVVAFLSTLLMVPSDRLVRRLIPMTSLLTVALGFPDAAPSRFKVAMRSATTAQVRRRIEAALAADVVEADLDRNQYLLDLIATLTRHDRLTRGHSERVRAYATLIGEELRLSKQEHQKLHWSALLHDIGKLDVPSEILNKEGRPNEDEWTILQNHPSAAERYLAPLSGWLGEWGKAATEHHLRWDGRGYPSDLGGTDISFAGRIVAIADAYDVMTSARSYKKPMSAADARVELLRCAGGQFDPNLVRSFLNIGLGRVRLAGGALTSLPALVTTVLGGFASNGGRVLMATAAVTTGAAAAPLMGIAVTEPVEIVAEFAPMNDVVAATPTPPAVPTETIPAVIPYVAVLTSPTPTPTPAAAESPLFDYALEAPTVSAAVPAIVVPATATPVASVTPTVVATPSPTRTPAVFDLAGPLVAAPEQEPTPLVPTKSVVAATAVPTSTPIASAIVEPLPTEVPAPDPTPTSTPTPTTVPTTTPTAGPVPTATLIPLATAVPTGTPLPTATSTPVPAATPTPLPEPCPELVGCPLAVGDAYMLTSNERVNLHVLDNDLTQGGSALDEDSLEIIDFPENDQDDILAVHDGHVHYQAGSTYVGSDSLTYQICNEDGLCDTATALITVTEDADPPALCQDFATPTALVSFDQKRRNARMLDGQHYAGPDIYVYLFAAVPASTQQVAFYFDDPDLSGSPLMVDDSCTYDATVDGAGGQPTRAIPSSYLGNGVHSLTIEVLNADNSTTVSTAYFEVFVTGNQLPPAQGTDCEDVRNGDSSPGDDADLTNCQFGGLNIDGHEWRYVNAAGVTLTNGSARGATFEEINLTGANFAGSDLYQSIFFNAGAEGASFEGASLAGVSFTQVGLTGASFSNAALSQASFTNVGADGASFQNADLTNAVFDQAGLVDASLRDANIDGIELRGTNLANADLTGATGTPAVVIDMNFDNTTCPDGSIVNDAAGCWA